MNSSVVWTPHQVEFVSDLDQPELALSPWAGHRWFAYDLVRWLRPARVVELGTFSGCSFFAFAQAVQDGGIDSELLAVGAWKSTDNSSNDGDAAFEAFSSVIEQRFATLRTRVERSTFQDALLQVADSSVDLLHLDGLHPFETIEHDLNAWLPKLTEHAIVLIHGVAPSTGSGPAHLWHQLVEKTPSFAFFHGHGLGVLLPHSGAGSEALIQLGQSPWRTYYDHRAAHDLFRRRSVELLDKVNEQDASLSAAKKMVGLRDRQLADAQRLVDLRDESLKASEASIAASSQEIVQIRQLLTTREAELAEARRALERRERELSLAAAGHQDLERQLANVTDQRRQLEAERTSLEAEVARLDSERIQANVNAEQLAHRLSILAEDRDAQAQRLQAYRKALGPVRWATRPARRLAGRLATRDRPELLAGTRLNGEETGRLRPTVVVGGAGEHDEPLLPTLDNAPTIRMETRSQNRAPEPVKDESEPQNGDNAVTKEVETKAKEPAASTPPTIDIELLDEQWYRDRYRIRLLNDRSSLEHYLDVGLSSGLFVCKEHEESVLVTGSLKPAPEELLTNIILQDSAGAQRPLQVGALADVAVDLVSFDLWDATLVRTRPCDAVKLATARRLRIALGLRPFDAPSCWELVRRREEIEKTAAGPNDGEFLVIDVLTQHLGELVPPGRYDVGALAQSLQRAELEDEKAGSVPIGAMMANIERLLSRDDKPTVAVVSEFHFTSFELRQLLASHGLVHERLKAVASADVGLSTPGKASLFEWLERNTGVDASDHLHVAHTSLAEHSSSEAPKRSFVYLGHGKRRYPPAGRLGTDYPNTIEELKAELDGAGRLRCQQRTGNVPDLENRLVLAGWRTALLPVALVAAAIEHAISYGIDRVHYLGRSGLFLAQVHDAVAATLVPELPTTAVQLDVSQLSTFGPSLHEIDPISLQHLWRAHPRQSSRDLLVSLGANPEDFASEIRHHDLNLDDAIGGVHLDERIRAFITDNSVAWRLGKLNEERRAGLLQYLTKRIDLQARQLFVVDTQPRGAIQDNLARLLPAMNFVGWYPALFSHHSEQGGNVEKHAIGPNANEDQSVSALNPYEALERAWTNATPPVSGYRSTTLTSGRPEPILGEQILSEDGQDSITAYQNAVVAAAPMVARWIVANGASTDVLKPYLVAEFIKFFEDPEPGVADLCFNSAFDTDFGANQIIRFNGTPPDRTWLIDGHGPRFQDRLDNEATASLWPAGYRRWHPVQAAVSLERSLRARRFD